jgi:hypothetical protein
VVRIRCKRPGGVLDAVHLFVLKVRVMKLEVKSPRSWSVVISLFASPIVLGAVVFFAGASEAMSSPSGVGTQGDVSLIARKQGSAEALGIQCVALSEREAQSEACEHFRFVKARRIQKDQYELDQTGVPAATVFTAEGVALLGEDMESVSEFRGVDVNPFPLALQTVSYGGMNASASWVTYLALPVDILTAPIHLPIQALISLAKGKSKEKRAGQLNDALTRARVKETQHSKPKITKLGEAQWVLLLRRIESCSREARGNRPVECVSIVN